jgi:hypothetical protein
MGVIGVAERPIAHGGGLFHGKLDKRNNALTRVD